MAWYLRKSVRLGPVRFNLSKSGISLSGGVTGFRVGVRPNGRSYVHAGRHGLYYRKELGGKQSRNKSQRNQNNQEVEQVVTSHPDAIKYNSASSQDLAPKSRKELIDKLNKSYKSTRLDYLCGGVFLILSLSIFSQSTIAGAIALLIGILSTIAIAHWESNRRTVSIQYDFEDKKGTLYKQLISAFNNLASNNNVWALIDSRNIGNINESKLNAGASNLVSRSDAQVGEGKPPWVETNIDVPVLKARSQTLYMMPDGILIYDDKGVGFVEYDDVSVGNGTTRFIEEKPPSDAEVVDHTWKHPNKKGGPDRRFKDNYEIPVCLYGELQIKSSSGLFLYLMTSKHNSPAKFINGIKPLIAA